MCTNCAAITTTVEWNIMCIFTDNAILKNLVQYLQLLLPCFEHEICIKAHLHQTVLRSVPQSMTVYINVSCITSNESCRKQKAVCEVLHKPLGGSRRPSFLVQFSCLWPTYTTDNYCWRSSQDRTLLINPSKWDK